MTPARNSAKQRDPHPSASFAKVAPEAFDVQPMLDRLCDRAAPVVFFPVRHHSPQAALLVAQLIADMRPAIVLIEGPSDFNDHLGELTLGHQLPIAIYSYFQTEAGRSSGAYYPFCDYSPEWSALQAATGIGAAVRFIDMPWSMIALSETTTHRYADAELRRGRYMRKLCQRLEVEDFDDLWDKLIESHERLALDDYFARVHSYCFQVRLWEEQVSPTDCQREAFMAEAISAAVSQGVGRILVITGGFHSSALAARLDGLECPGLDSPEKPPTDKPPAVMGIALTSYSYDRLDGLTGYNAGMPNPGFYDHAWQQRSRGDPFSHHALLAELVLELRRRKQTLSTADLIAVDTTARALAALRGRGHVWRSDLVDAVTSSLIKDELEYGCESPFVDAVHAILRGNRRGRLADGTRLPPLVRDIQEQLSRAELELKRGLREETLDLLTAGDLAKSRLLHRIRLLGIRGIDRIEGTDFLRRHDLTNLWEKWRLRWSPDFDSSCIEASRYGVSLIDAAASRLQEMVGEQPQHAADAAALLVQAAQAGIDTLTSSLQAGLKDLILKESEFAPAAQALGHILFLYCFDEAFGTTHHPELGWLLRLTFERSLWLLELVGQTLPNTREALDGMQTLLETFQRTGDVLEIDATEFGATVARVENDAQKPPAMRGAAAGILWNLRMADADAIMADLLAFADPNDLGDFLAGLFAVARELAQRHPPLVNAIDQMLLEFSPEHFQTALPSLRLAFTYFTPREKHSMLTTLFDSLGLTQVKPLEAVSVATAADALAIDERVFEAIRLHGLDEPGEES